MESRETHKKDKTGKKSKKNKKDSDSPGKAAKKRKLVSDSDEIEEQSDDDEALDKLFDDDIFNEVDETEAAKNCETEPEQKPEPEQKLAQEETPNQADADAGVEKSLVVDALEKTSEVAENQVSADASVEKSLDVGASQGSAEASSEQPTEVAANQASADASLEKPSDVAASQASADASMEKPSEVAESQVSADASVEKSTQDPAPSQDSMDGSGNAQAQAKGKAKEKAKAKAKEKAKPKAKAKGKTAAPIEEGSKSKKHKKDKGKEKDKDKDKDKEKHKRKQKDKDKKKHKSKDKDKEKEKDGKKNKKKKHKKAPSSESEEDKPAEKDGDADKMDSPADEDLVGPSASEDSDQSGAEKPDNSAAQSDSVAGSQPMEVDAGERSEEKASQEVVGKIVEHEHLPESKVAAEVVIPKEEAGIAIVAEDVTTKEDSGVAAAAEDVAPKENSGVPVSAEIPTLKEEAIAVVAATVKEDAGVSVVAEVEAPKENAVPETVELNAEEKPDVDMKNEGQPQVRGEATEAANLLSQDQITKAVDANAVVEGQIVKAKYGNSHFDATVLSVSGDTIRVKYHYDDSETDVPRTDLLIEGQKSLHEEKCHEEKWDKVDVDMAANATDADAAAGSNFSTGQQVKAKYGNSHFEATVVSVSCDVVRVKYGYDGSEADLPSADVLAEGATEDHATEVANEEEEGVEWNAVSQASICWEAGTWLNEDNHRRTDVFNKYLKKVRLRSNDDGEVKVKVSDPDGEESVANKQAKLLLRCLDAAQSEKMLEESPPSESDIQNLQVLKAAMPGEESEAVLSAIKQSMSKFDVIPVLFDWVDPDFVFNVGDKCKAKFGNSFFGAEILEVTEESAKIKYEYDNSEAEVPKSDLQAITSGTRTLYMFGNHQCCTEMVLVLWQELMKRKSMTSSFFEGLSDCPPDAHGFSYLRLRSAGKAVGAKGATVKKIAKITNTNVKCWGRAVDAVQFAVTVGTGPDRERAMFLLELVQNRLWALHDLDELPKYFEGFSETVETPEAVISNLDVPGIETKYNCLLAAVKMEEDNAPAELVVDKEVEGKYGSNWHKCKIVEVGDTIKVRWGYDDSEVEVSKEDLRAISVKAKDEESKLVIIWAGSPEEMENTKARLMAQIERFAPGTYLPDHSGKAKNPVSKEFAAKIKAEYPSCPVSWAKGVMSNQDKENSGNWRQKDGGKSWGNDRGNSWSKKDDDRGNSWNDDKNDGGDKWNSDSAWDSKAGSGWNKDSWNAGGSGAQDWNDNQIPRPNSTHGAIAHALKPQQLAPAAGPVASQPCLVDPRTGMTDTAALLMQYGVPSTMEDWAQNQGFFFAGHPEIPQGWMRVWSRSRLCPYFVRLADNASTFEWNEMLRMTQM